MVRSRLRLLMVLASLPFLVILGRLYSLQILQEEKYRALADGRRRNLHLIPTSRGRILARNGAVLAADQTLFDLMFTLDDLHPRERFFSILQKSLRLCLESPFPGKDQACTCRVLEEHLVKMLGTPLEMELRASQDEAPPDEPPRGEPAAAGWVQLVTDIPVRTVRGLSRKFRSSLLAGGLYFAMDPDRDAYSLWARSRAVAALELTLLRLSRLCGSAPPPGGPGGANCSYEALRAAVFNAEKEVNQGKNLAERAMLRERERMLLREVSREVVTEVLYHPERYPGIRVADRRRRIFPLGESAGIVTGYLVRMPDARQAELRQNGLLLDLSRADMDLFFEAFRDLRETGRFADEEVGERGLEGVYDSRLRGRHGLRMDILDFLGRSRPDQIIEPVRGNDVETTLDADLQKLVYEALKRDCGELGSARAGTALVMALDWNAGAKEGVPGAMLAMACYPTFDPNRMRSAEYLKKLQEDAQLRGTAPFLNRPRAAFFPPGSVFKLLVAVAALESGVTFEGGHAMQRPLLPDETYACRYIFDESSPNTFRCNHTDGHGVPGGLINLQQAISFSCNCYFYHLGQDRLRADLLWAWARNFGLGRNVEIDLDRPLDQQKSFEAGRLDRQGVTQRSMRFYAIGQVHVTSSPLQVLRAVAGIATNGYSLPWPYLVEPRPPEPIGTSRPWTIAAIKEGMRLAASEPGGTAAKPEFGLTPFNVAVKTGTAQMARGKKEYYAWIAGFAPHDRPEIAFVVCLENTPSSGGEATAPVLREILRYFAQKEPARYLQEPPAGRGE